MSYSRAISNQILRQAENSFYGGREEGDGFWPHSRTGVQKKPNAKGYSVAAYVRSDGVHVRAHHVRPARSLRVRRLAYRKPKGSYANSVRGHKAASLKYPGQWKQAVRRQSSLREGGPMYRHLQEAAGPYRAFMAHKKAQGVPFRQALAAYHAQKGGPIHFTTDSNPFY